MNSVCSGVIVHIGASDVAGKKEHTHILPIHPGPLDQIASTHTGHVEIANKDVVLIALHEFDRRSTVVKTIGTIATISKDGLDQFGDVILIIDNQHRSVRRQQIELVDRALGILADGVGHDRKFDREGCAAGLVFGHRHLTADLTDNPSR